MDKIKVKVLKCPICGEKKCYEDTHVEENGNIELSEWLCYGCGYTSTSKYVTDSDEYEEMMPKVIVNLKILDPSRNIFWYPSILQTTKGYVFPELSAEDWHWFSAPIVEIEEKDMDKLPPGSDGKIGDLVIALWLGKQFGKYKFYEACESLGLMIDRHENIEEEDETSNAT